MSTMGKAGLGLAAVMLLLTAGGCGKTPVRFCKERSAVSPEGWPGSRYYENNYVKSEIWDAVGRDGQPDVWRYYDTGRLFREERDFNGDGKADAVALWNAKMGWMESLVVDSDCDGVADDEVKWLGGGKWRQSLDRNRDGVMDLVFDFSGKERLLTDSGVKPAVVEDLRKLIAPGCWSEVALDSDFDRRFDKWERYKAGAVYAFGVDKNGDGTVDAWVKPGEEQQAKGPAGVQEAPGADDSVQPLPLPESEQDAPLPAPDSVAAEENAVPEAKVSARVIDSGAAAGEAHGGD